MRLTLRTLVVMLVAVFLPAVSTGTAEAATASPCHGYVYSFTKSSGYVRMTYWIYCTRSVDHLSLRPFLRQNDRWSSMTTFTCSHTWVCQGTAKLADKTGSQWYQASVADAESELLIPVSFAKDDGGPYWICHDNMSCTGDAKYF